MKLFKYTMIAFCMLSSLFSCEKGTPEIPDACLKAEVKQLVDDQMVFVESTNVTLGESMFFSSCGESDYAVIYPGDNEHDYPTSEKDTVNFGFPLVSSDRFEYVYAEAGVYTATLLATNISIYSSSKTREFERATAVVTITVSE